MKINKQLKRKNRQKRIKARIRGTSVRPRLSVFRSNKSMFAQLIDDEKGITLASVSSGEVKKEGEKISKVVVAGEIGKAIAKKAIEKKIAKVVFDRGGYKYHGRVKMLADGAREGGLEF